MSTIDSRAAATGESHRDRGGRLGAQPAPETPCQLSALDRDAIRSTAITTLSDFDPCNPGRSEADSNDLLTAHSTMVRGCSPGATTIERARALAACIRGSLVDHGGLSPSDYDTVMCGVLPTAQSDSLALAELHRDVDQHLYDVRTGTALVGDHLMDGDVLNSYRTHLGVREPVEADLIGQVNELVLAWSYRLDCDVMELASRHTSSA